MNVYRIDDSKRMHRYYRMDVQPDLFGSGASCASGAALEARGGRAALPSLPRRRRKQRSTSSAASRSGGDITIQQPLDSRAKFVICEHTGRQHLRLSFCNIRSQCWLSSSPELG
jgi:hypothetical protein